VGNTPDSALPHLFEALDHLAAGLNQLVEGERNLAIQQAMLDDRLLRVERNRLFSVFNRAVGAGASLSRRLGLSEETEDPAAYAKWVEHEAAASPSVEAARAASRDWAYRPAISVILTVRKGETVAEFLESLGGQAYENWELCAAIDGACEPQLAGFRGALRKVAADGLDDAQALNAAAALSTGEYISVAQPAGVLAPLALYRIAEALQQGPFDLLYSDEDSLDEERRRVRPVFRPGWSPELLTSCMYPGSLLTIRRERFVEAGGSSSDCGDAHLFDLLLRLADAPLRVHHIPGMLYHGIGGTSAAAGESAARAIARAVSRREKTEVTCVSGLTAGTWIARRKRSAGEMTAVICSKSPELLETCLKSLRETAPNVVRQIIVVAHEESGPNSDLREVIQTAGATAVSYHGLFHFAVMNNLGARSAEAPAILFLNDDVSASSPGWAELLSEQTAREEVGIAGAVLWYPDGVLQHAGIVTGIGDGVGHAGRYQSASQLWPWLLAMREVSAVTGACMAIRRELFQELGGFDEGFPNNYNDVDLCFRARSQGYRVICVPVTGLEHVECQSRPGIVRFEERYRFYERWGQLLRNPDPYYSAALAPTEKIAVNANDDHWYRPLFC
jgi:GT2 family glycosyltransferase